MTIYLGDFPAGETIYIPFHTFNSTGASVTITGLAVTDIEIYKDGSTTQRASDAGYTLLDTDGIDFDGLTGIHGFSINTADNTDAGFFVAGSDYWVVVSAITVDSQTVNFVPAIFSIENRSALRPTTAGRTLDVASTGEAGLDFSNVNIPVGAVKALGFIDNGTLQSATASGAVLRSAASFANDLIIGSIIVIVGGTGVGQARVIHDSVLTGDAISISPDWVTTPDNTSDYIIVASPPAPTNSAVLPVVSIGAINGDIQSMTDLKAFVDTGFDPATNKVQGVVLTDTVTTYTGNTPQTGDSYARIGATGSGLTSLASQSSVNTIDDFLDTEVAAVLAAVDTEIATIVTAVGTTIPAALTTIDDFLDTEIAAIVTAVGTTIPAALTTIDDFLDTEVAAIKAKTDSLTFTVAGVVDANIQRVNDVAIQGDGTLGDEWRPV